MVIFEEFLDFYEVLDEAIQALNDAAAHLLLPPPDQQQILTGVPQQVPSPEGHAQTLPQNLIYNSESEPDRDDEMD